MTDKFNSGDPVRAIYRDAVGQAAVFDGKVVRKSEKDGHWAVNLGWIVIHLPEKDIEHVEQGQQGDAGVQAGPAPLGQQEGAEGQKP